MQERTEFEPTVPQAIKWYWWLVMLSALAGAALGFLTSALFLNSSEAVATVLIEDPSSSRVFDTEPATRPERYLASQVAILESPEMAQEAMDLEPSPGLSTSQVLEARNITADSETDLIEISFSDPDREVAVGYANAYARAYEIYREEVTRNDFEAAIAELDSSIRELDQEIAAIDVELEAGPSIAGEGTGPQIDEAILLETRRDILDRRSQLVVRRDQLRVDAALTSTGIVAVSEAIEAEQSVSTQRVVAIVAVLGVLGGVTAAYGLAVRNRRFGHRSEPELVLDVPGLAEIPELRSKHLIPVLDSPTSSEAEAFRFAASAIGARLVQPESVPESEVSTSITITSALPGEGKTIVTVNVGLSVATKGKAVLLIDGDFDDPSLTRMMVRDMQGGVLGLADIVGDMQGVLGLTDIVEGQAAFGEVVVPIGLGSDHHVDVLTKGTLDITPTDFFNSPTAQKLISAIRLRYDYVLIDAPSLLHTSYTTALASLTDSVITVIPHNGLVSTQVEVLQRLELVRAKLIGYVYNRGARTVSDVSWRTRRKLIKHRKRPSLTIEQSRVPLGLQ